MPKQRTNFSGAEKIAILRKHLLPKVPITEVCEQHGLQPTIFYDWHKKLFKQYWERTRRLSYWWPNKSFLQTLV